MFLASIWLVAHAACFAEDKVWLGMGSTDWFEPANWSPSGVPASEDTALIYSNTVVLTADVVIHRIVLQSGAVDGAGNLAVTNFSWRGGNVSGTGMMLIPEGGLLTIDTPTSKYTQRTSRMTEPLSAWQAGGLEVEGDFETGAFSSSITTTDLVAFRSSRIKALLAHFRA
jgi:hypothetical protein